MSSISILKRYVLEEAIRVSKEYMSKEKVREEIQNMIVERVSSGEIKDQKELEEFWKTVDMACSALKMISYSTFKGISKR